MANINISDLDYEFSHQELTDCQQAALKGGSWLSDLVDWVVDHIGGSFTDGGVIITYKGTHDFPNNL